jgi:OTU domain-containing protein 3
MIKSFFFFKPYYLDKNYNRMGPKLKNQKKLSQKEERSVKYINLRKKDSYLADDNNFEVFAKQLSKLGLELRDITGDGNCLFRALSDQIDGNETNHLLYRKQVCEYMRKNRGDFEPFVVGLVDEIEHRKRGGDSGNIDKKLEPFEKYVSYLEQATTYGGNDALVAFSKLHEVDIYLHQIDQPIWRVNGAFLNAKNIKQLHLSYHNGEHYSSVRRIGDLNNTPANIHVNTVDGSSDNHQTTKNKKASASYYDYNEDYLDDFSNNEEILLNQMNSLNLETTYGDGVKGLEDVLDNIINITNCFDVNLIKEVYNENNGNAELTITRLLGIFNTNDNDDENEENEEVASSCSKKKSKNLKPREKKQLKKQKQMERQRNKVLEERDNERVKISKVDSIGINNNNSNEDDVLNIQLNNIEAKNI